MNKWLILCFAFMMSCTGTTAQKSENMQKDGEILISESQGGSDKSGFTIIKSEQEFQKAIRSKQTFTLVEEGKESEIKYPAFPKNKKVVLYNLGRFSAGDHRITEIRSISVKDNILYVEIPMREFGGMEIQVISNPWFIFTVPSDYQFTSVQLKSSNKNEQNIFR